MLVVTTPAPDPTLLSTAEVAAALGEGSDANATDLTTLNNRASALLAEACGVVRAGQSVITLRAETLTETLRPLCSQGIVTLSRFPVIEIVSATEGTSELTTDDWESDSDRGLLRLSSGSPGWWAAEKTVVVYRAGWVTVPHSLKALAAKLVVSLWTERGRDPSLGSYDIPGVISETFRYGRPDDPLITSEIMEGLANGGFLNRQGMVG